MKAIVIEGNYGKQSTGGVKPLQAYEKDFENPGQFEEKKSEGIINLQAHWWPGIYHNKQWRQTPPDEESFLISATYRNKNNIKIVFEAKSADDRFLGAFRIVKNAAKKFFLVNDLISDVIFASSGPTWEEVQEIIKEKAVDIPGVDVDLDFGNNWSKTMTLAEAKELFAFLKIEAKFPA